MFLGIERLALPGYEGVLFQYRDFLPVTENTPMFSLGEGNTALIRLSALEEKLRTKGVRAYAKAESENRPTGSFKDRGMVVAAAKGAEAGASGFICASTGNTSASAAAYGAALGIAVKVVVSEDAAEGKVSQAMMYGADVIKLSGNFDEALQHVKRIAERNKGLCWLNSANPNRIEGQKTAAFEIVDALGDAPHYLFLPVGNAGNITAYWKGFKEYKAAGKSTRLPRMMGFEAAGANPIERGERIDKPQTAATAIKIGNPYSWRKAVEAKEQSEGIIASITDEEILEAQYLLSAGLGVSLFVEPASAASLAGLLKYDRETGLEPNSTVVLVLTGSGLKDPETAISNAKAENPIRVIKPGEDLEGIITGST